MTSGEPPDYVFFPIVFKNHSNNRIRGFTNFTKLMYSLKSVFLSSCSILLPAIEKPWHGCPKCYKPPSTRQEYWKMKLSHNMLRDLEVTSVLVSKGYIVMRFWEHDIIKDAPSCATKVLEVVSSRKN